MLVPIPNQVKKRVIHPSRPTTNRPELPIGIGPDSAAIVPPQSAQMAGDLLKDSSQIILDHYSTTQGRRVTRMMQENPTELLAEMWGAMRNLNLTAAVMARAQSKREQPDHELISTLRLEAYQSIYPAVETPEEDELSAAQRQRLYVWIETLADEPDTQSKENIKNLLAAAKKGDEDAVRKLFNEGIDPAACDAFDATALHIAAAWGRIGVMDILFERRVPVQGVCTARDFDTELGWRFIGTPLHMAAAGNQPEAAQALIRHGAHVNEPDPISLRTPIFYAAAYGSTEALKVLLRSRAVVNLHESLGDYCGPTAYTPLHYAARNGHLETVRMLLEHEANPRIVDPHRGETPLDLAKAEGHEEIVKLLANAQNKQPLR